MPEEPIAQTTPEAPTAPEVPEWVPEKFRSDPAKYVREFEAKKAKKASK